MTAILIGTPVINGSTLKRVPRLGESDVFVLKDHIKRIHDANNNPKKQYPKRHEVFLPNKACNRMDYIKRQNSLTPDKDVPKEAKSFLTNNNQFRKHIFVDGTQIVAPKGHLMSGAKHNGAKKQGLNTMFRPAVESKENGGFIAA